MLGHMDRHITCLEKVSDSYPWQKSNYGKANKV